MHRRAFVLFVGSLAATLAVWLGCASWNDAALPELDDGGADASDGGRSTEEGGAGCPVVHVPLTPSRTPQDVKEEFVVTLHNITLGLDAGVLDPTFGFDLDDKCTCSPDPESCIAPSAANVDVRRDAGCDGLGGRDNGTGKMVESLRGLINDPATYANEAIDKGLRGILLRVRGYNGADDDSDVEVSVYRSLGPGTGSTAPTFSDPNEEWSVDRLDLKQGGSGYDPATIAVGYVVGKRLVALLKTSTFPFNSDADIILNNVQLTATIAKQNGHYVLNDAIAVGRWHINDVLQTVSKVNNPQASGERLCQSPLFGAVVAEPICAAVDIADLPERDNTGNACNALSTAVGFIGTPAKLGTIVSPERVNPCEGFTIPSCN